MADVQRILEYYKTLQSEKQLYLPVFETLNQFVRLRKQSFIGEYLPGTFLISGEIFDATAINANSIMSAALIGNMWPNGARSIRIVKPDSLGNTTAIENYYKTISQIAAEKMDHPKARLSLAINEDMNDLGAFGTCGIAVFANKGNKDNPLSYKVWDVKTMSIDEDANGIVDTICNEFSLTVRQVVEEYGLDKCSEQVQKLYKDGKYQEKISILHAIMPRPLAEQKEGGNTNKGKKVASYHIEMKSNHLLRESGYDSIPVVVSRFYKVPGEKYGRSPAMQAIPDILELNAVREGKMLATEKLMSPPLMVLDDGTLGAGEIDDSPNGVTVVNVSGRISNQDPIKPLYTVGELQSVENHTEQLRQQITQAFFIDRLLDLNNDTRMTLGEAQIRNRIRGESLTSIFDRQELELFVPLIDRSMGILLDEGLLGVKDGSDEQIKQEADGQRVLTIPPEVQDLIDSGREWYKIQFISPAKRMQQAEELQGIYATMEIAAGAAQYDATVLDWINKDVMLRRATELSGGPSELINSEDTVLEVRQARAEQQAALAEQERMRNESEVARNMAQAQSMAVQSGI